tara:strand:- start:716 stop:1432 length:717 start_codon:yes stop_codon:yes gene_type:complete
MDLTNFPDTVAKLEQQNYSREQLKIIFMNLQRKRFELNHEKQRTPFTEQKLKAYMDELNKKVNSYMDSSYYSDEGFSQQIVSGATQVVVLRKRIEEEQKRNSTANARSSRRRMEHRKRLAECGDVAMDWNRQDALDRRGRDLKQAFVTQLTPYEVGATVIVTDNRDIIDGKRVVKGSIKYEGTITSVGPSTAQVNGKPVQVPPNKYFILFEDKSWAIVGRLPTSKEQYYISGLVGDGD